MKQFETTKWPQAKVVKLINKLCNSESPTQTAREIGTTKNAVVGKVWRLSKRLKEADARDNPDPTSR